MRTLKDLEVSGKRAFVRADLDVTLEDQRLGGERDLGHEVQLEGTLRLARLKETIDFLLENGNHVTIAGHINRPTEPTPQLSTRMLIQPLKKLLGIDIEFQEDFFQQPQNSVTLLENLRFNQGETTNDPRFAASLASHADLYINEAFGNSHREHASMVTMPKLLPGYAGINLEREVQVLSEVLDKPSHPFVAIIGGAKIDTKLPVIKRLSRVADVVLVGGILSSEISDSSITLPDNVEVAEIDESGQDITIDSQKRFAEIIRRSNLVVWNGAMGVFEQGHAKGTLAIVEAIKGSSAFSVAGGGQTAEFLAKYGLTDDFSFVSTGGGAMLDFLAGKELPALQALAS